MEIIAVPLFISNGHYMNKSIPKRLGLRENTYSGGINMSGQNVDLHITNAFENHPNLKHVLKSVRGNIIIKNRLVYY